MTEAALQSPPAEPAATAPTPSRAAIPSTAPVESAADRCRQVLDWLAADLPGLVAAVIVLRSEDGTRFVPAAVWPPHATDLSTLADSADRALRERRGVELMAPAAPDDARPRYTQIALPIEAAPDLVGAIAVGATTATTAERQHIRRRLYWSSAWIVHLGLRDQLRAARERVAEVTLIDRITEQTLAASGFDEAAGTLVDSLANAFGLHFAQLGVARHGQIVLTQGSLRLGTEGLPAEPGLLQAAMQEAFDQALDIVHPSTGNGRVERAVSDEHARLSAAVPGRIIQSLLLQAHGHPWGVLLLGHMPTLLPGRDPLPLVHSLAQLLGPALAEKRELDRWLNGRLPRRLRSLRRTLLGPYRLSWKLFAGLGVAAAAGLILAEGPFRITARTVIEGEVLRAVVAPYDGFLRDTAVRAGHTVAAGQVLATLDDRDIQLEKVRWESEAEQTARKYRDALAKHDRATAAVYGAQLHEARAQLALAVEKLARTVIRAPFDGFVVTGDLNQLRGSAVEQGKVLFEVTPLDAYRVVLKVEERDIGYLRIGQSGTLALSGLIGRSLPFQVNRVTAVASSDEGINFFRVEAKLSEAHPGLRPGMEGIGKVTVGRDRYWWIWSRQLVDWVRLTVWSWWP